MYVREGERGREREREKDEEQSAKCSRHSNL